DPGVDLGRIRSERGQQQEAEHPYAMLVVHPSLLDGILLNPIREKTRQMAGFVTIKQADLI
ncbi:hypothetical protein NL539_12020, partial [Aeromonas sp. CPF2-S1]|nr:hypothetical protein [Aeromonas sp. CPF2-S1]